MHCIKTTRLAVLWNGKQLEWFSPSRGIRQGDAMSPYIFVLCMERLGHIIQSVVEEGKWKTIQFSCNGPKLSHLFFVDDLILFSKALVEQISIVKNCLDVFCAASRQRVNLQKSSICLSQGVSNVDAREISQISGLPLTGNLRSYLGTPSIHGRVTSGMFQQILDKMTSKLES